MQDGIGQVEREDYAKLAEFLAGFPDEKEPIEFWRERLTLWWERNPALDDANPRGWVLRDDGAIKGFLGNVPSEFQIEGRVLPAYGATTWRVLPSHRSASIPLYLAQIDAAASRGILFNTTSGERGAKVLEYLKFSSLPSYASLGTVVIVLAASRAARAFLEGHRVRPAAALIGLGLALAQSPQRLTLRPSRALRVRELENADDVDDLWSRTCSQRGCTTVRSTARISWFCFGSPRFAKSLLGCYDGVRLRGYLVLGRGTWRGLSFLEALDLWVDHEARTDVIVSLVSAAKVAAKRRGSDLLLLHDFDEELAQLFPRRAIFFAKKDARRHYFRNEGPTHAPLTPARSYLTALEGDLGV